MSSSLSKYGYYERYLDYCATYYFYGDEDCFEDGGADEDCGED